MKQNIYDDEDFFSAYKEYRKSPKCLNSAIEQSALKRLLPDLKGIRVLDIGSGMGPFCEYALEQGADFVVGVDISRLMCAAAESLLQGKQNVKFINEAIEDFKWNGPPFDLIVSSLTLHYVEPNEFDKVIQQLSSWLRNGGMFIMSVNHPIYTATLGKDHSPDSSTLCDVRNYWQEGRRQHTWEIDGVLKYEGVIKYHRTLETYFQVLKESGLCVTDFRELSPRSAGVEEWIGDPKLSERPIFVLFKAIKENGKG